MSTAGLEESSPVRSAGLRWFRMTRPARGERWTRRAYLFDRPRRDGELFQKTLPQHSVLGYFTRPSETKERVFNQTPPRRKRLCSSVGVDLIPRAGANWFGTLLAFGWSRPRLTKLMQPLARLETMSDRLTPLPHEGKATRKMQPTIAPNIFPYRNVSPACRSSAPCHPAEKGLV
jgi:hypothetical protein